MSSGLIAEYHFEKLVLPQLTPPTMAVISLLNNFEQVPIGARKQAYPDEILYCQGDRNYTHVYMTNDRKVLVSLTLGVLESRLASKQFLRLTRSWLVNKQHIRDYDGSSVTLSNGMTVEVARRRRHEVYLSLSSNAKRSYQVSRNPKEMDSGK